MPNDNASLDSYYRQLTSEAKTEAWLSALAELKAQGYEAAYADLKLEELYELGFPAPGAVWNEEAAIREQPFGYALEEQVLSCGVPIFKARNRFPANHPRPIRASGMRGRLSCGVVELAFYQATHRSTREIGPALGCIGPCGSHPRGYRLESMVRRVVIAGRIGCDNPFAGPLGRQSAE